MINPSYSEIQLIPDRVLNTLKVDTTLNDLTNPYEVVEGYDDNMTLFKAKDISFVNTSEFSRSAKYFLKNGVYTKAHPIYDKDEYDAFWDEEERRCIEGITLPVITSYSIHYTKLYELLQFYRMCWKP